MQMQMQNGHWTHGVRMVNERWSLQEWMLNNAERNYWIQFWLQVQWNANECKRNRKLMQWKANATEHQHIGTEMQQNSNATECKRRLKGVVIQQNTKETLCKCFFSANAMEHKRKSKQHSTQTERELFDDHYCTPIISTHHSSNGTAVCKYSYCSVILTLHS